MIFCTLSYTNAWWVIDIMNNCPQDAHLVVYVRYGVCIVNHSRGGSRNDCIGWNDEEKWKEISDISGTNVDHAANVLFPIISGMAMGTLISSVLLLACYIYHLYRPIHSQRQQYTAALLSVTNMLMTFWVGMDGGRSDITKLKTWTPFTTCKDGYSYPYIAYYSLAIACCMLGVLTAVAIFPAKFCCFHLVEVEEAGFLLDPKTDDFNDALRESLDCTIAVHEKVHYENEETYEAPNPS